jgi:hypothetical protein
LFCVWPNGGDGATRGDERCSQVDFGKVSNSWCTHRRRNVLISKALENRRFAVEPAVAADLVAAEASA